MLDTCTERLGLATELVCSAPRRAGYDLNYIRLRIQPAIMHDQIYFAFDERGRVVALWTWAFLAPDVEERLIREPRAVLHESEWNEGSRLWLLDLIAPRGYVRDVVRFIRRSFFQGQDRAISVRARTETHIKVREWRRPVIDGRSLRAGTHALRFSLSEKAFSASRSDWLRRSAVDADSEPQRWLRERSRDALQRLHNCVNERPAGSPFRDAAGGI